MTIMTNTHYERGVDAANRSLDRTGASASDMLGQARSREKFYRNKEHYSMAEWCKGFGDTVQEFLDNQGQ
jgi:hypothetical protein